MRMTGLGRATVLMTSMIVLVGCEVAFAQHDSETVNKTLPFPSDGTLRLRNFSGDVRITTTNGRDVAIKAVREANRDQLDHIKLDIQSSGSTISIDANMRDSGWSDRNHNDNVVKTTFDIQVPASAKLDVDVFSSPVTVDGVTGEQRLKTFSGKISVTGARAAVTAESFNGDVDIDARQASSPEMTIQTFSGHIGARLADTTRASVTFDTFSGRFDSDLPLSIHSNHSRDRVRPGRSTASTSSDRSTPASDDSRLRFHTFSGDVHISK